jgi:Mor family transcriptional regulator
MSSTKIELWRTRSQGWVAYILLFVSETLSLTDAKHLLRLCKLGKLFEVQDWIASGNSLCVPADLRTTPLDVALDTGFHSLVELLVRNEASQDLKNQALRHSVSLKRRDFIELLVSSGADTSSVPFIAVLRVWEPTIIRYFLDHGADFINDSPFAVAFGERIRTALGPWRECREKYPDLAPQLQEQADRALRHFCWKGDLKWVSLLMWAGADPRSSGPTLDDDNLDESEYCSALSAAAYGENLEILKRLRPDAKRDDIDGLLTTAAGGGRADVVRYLFELGAKPNDKANGGSSGLDDCLERIPFESFRHSFSFTGYRDKSKASKYAISNTRATIQLLLEHAALWRPDGAEQVARVRRSLLECEPDITLDLVERLMKHSACSNDTIRELLRTPTMKKHVTEIVRKFVGMGFDVRTTEQKAEDKRQKKISHEWALRELASRYNREEIYEEIWSEAIQKVAKKYNLSDVGLAKVCRKLNIPRPGRGYWAKKAAGKVVPKRPPLLALF